MNRPPEDHPLDPRTQSIPAGVEKDDKNQVFTNAVSMAFGTFSSRLLALFREVFLLSLFPRNVTDAWIAAFRLPNLFRRLLGEGSLSVSFIPIFIEANHQSEERAKNLTNGVYTCLLFVLVILTTLGVLFPEPILSVLLDEKYIQNTEQFLLTVRMARIMFSFVFLVSLYAFYMGILNALGKFGLAAAAPTLFNVAMIASTLLPTDWFPVMGDGLAWGVIVGGFLQMIVLVPMLRRKGYFPKITGSLKHSFQNPDVLKVFRNMVPGLFGLGVLQFTTLLNQNFASRLGSGAITYIYTADRLLELPLSLVSVSLGTALLPTLSGLWSRGEKDKMSKALADTMSLNLYVVMAASLGLYMLARPVLEILYFRGHFSVSDLEATTGVLKIWALIMIPTSLVRVFLPSYYAVKNTWFPAVVSVLCLGVHWMIAPGLMEQWGLSGLNYSSLVSSSLNIGLLFLMYPFLVHRFPVRNWILSLMKFSIPLSAMAGVLFFYTDLETHFLSLIQSSSFALLKTIAHACFLMSYIGVSAVVFFSVSHLAKIEAYDVTFGRILKKVSRRFYTGKL